MSTTDNVALHKQLVDRIAREVLYRIDKEQDEEHISSGTVALLTSYIPNHRSAIAAIEKIYKEQIDYIEFDDNTMPDGLHLKVKKAKDLGNPAVLDLVAKKRMLSCCPQGFLCWKK